MNETHDLAGELTAYIDGELSEIDAARVAAALQADPTLRLLEQRLRATVAVMKALPSPQTSSSLRRSVLDGLDTGANRTMWQRLRTTFTLPRLIPLAGAAAAAIAVVLSSQRPDEKPFTDDSEQLVVAQNLEVLEDLDVVGLDGADDLDVVQNLHELEGTP